MAVIDAAVKWRIYVSQGGYRLVGQERELAEAVTEYSKHELAAPSKTYTNLHSPETAHEAGEWAKKFALTDAGMVFRQIYYAWRRWKRLDEARGFAIGERVDEGMTSDEIEAELNRTHQSISARVHELKSTGWIIDSGQRRKTRSGGNAIVWTPTLAAITHVNEHGLPLPVTPRG